MPKPSSLFLAKAQISRHFTDAAQKIYSEPQLAGLLLSMRQVWRLTKSTRISDFIEFLHEHGELSQHLFRCDSYDRKITRYAWGDVSDFSLALSLKPRGYLSHGTAVVLHRLVETKLNSIHLNAEQSDKGSSTSTLTQTAIDAAFSRKQRQSNLTYDSGKTRVTIIAGKNTNRLAVEEVRGPSLEPISVTSIERTLVDITVRPAYSGGIKQAARAYHAAKDRLSVDRLLSILNDLDYVYPYHQAIGFLMEFAGYPPQFHEPLRARGLNWDFYLEHGMKSPKYSEKWRLYYPRTFTDMR